MQFIDLLTSTDYTEASKRKRMQMIKTWHSDWGLEHWEETLPFVERLAGLEIQYSKLLRTAVMHGHDASVRQLVCYGPLKRNPEFFNLVFILKSAVLIH